MKRLTAFTIFLSLFYSFSLFGQSAEASGVIGSFSLVPPWPEKGVPSAEQASQQAVYEDMKTGEYVLYYPETGEPDAPYIEVRVRKGNLVDLSVSTDVKQVSDSLYSYSYTVTNGNAARFPITKISLVVPPDEAPVDATHPSWISPPKLPVAIARMKPPVAPQAALYDPPALRRQANIGKFLSWSASDRDSIAKGNSLPGFSVASILRPGWTSVYATGGSLIAVPGELPERVAAQLTPVMRVEYNWASTLVIGPKFGKDIGNQWIANDWLFGLERLIRQGRLNEDSELVAEVRVRLREVADSGQGLYPNTVH